MERYTPSKQRIMAEWARHIRRKTRPPGRCLDIPKNDAPWNTAPLHTLSDVLKIVDQIALIEKKWNKPLKNS